MTEQMSEGGPDPAAGGGPMAERMRTLLSRAAEEQLSEQRQASTVLAELRGLVASLSGQLRAAATSAGLQSASDDLGALVGELGEQVAGLAAREQLQHVGEALESSLGARLEHLEAAASRPVVAPDQLEESVRRLEARLDETAAAAPVLERLGGLDGRLDALERNVEGLGERLSEVRDAAGGIADLRTDVEGVSRRLSELAGWGPALSAVRSAVETLRDDSPLPSLVLGVASLRADVEDLTARTGELDVPTAQAVAGEVGEQLPGPLGDALAPRVAELVLSLVAETLVEQVSGSVVRQVQRGLDDRVRAANAETERRLTTHVDEAVLALAEALLRRRRGDPAVPATWTGAGGSEPVADDPRGSGTGHAEDDGEGADDLEPSVDDPAVAVEGIAPDEGQAPGDEPAGASADAQRAGLGGAPAGDTVEGSAQADEPPSTAAQDPSGDAAPLVASAPAAPVFSSSAMPQGEPAARPDRPQSGPAGAFDGPVADAQTAEPGHAEGGDQVARPGPASDDDSRDTARRRPWWRP